MDLLQHPDARVLLEDAHLAPAAVQSCPAHLEAFVARYLPRFYRDEQRQHARTILRGKLTGLERKTTEPIATQFGQKRRPLQLFVGAGGWDDQAVLGELRQHVREELADAEAVFILDPSAFPKKGTASCGVARQWCGRLGKVDNCQVGVFLAYAAPRGCALLDGRLYLTADWAADAVRRALTHVPEDVTFQEKWRLGLELLDRARATLPGRWVVGDDELGRCTALRAALRQRRLSYVLDVPCNTLVRELSERRPPSRPGGAARRPLFERVDQWLARQPKGRWRTVTVRDGEKGPLRVKVLLARVQGARHRIEELLAQGNQEIGLDHYEVRSWVGWHHHMTLSLVALWFLQLERLRLGGKNPGGDAGAGADDLYRVTAAAAARRGSDRCGGQPGAAA